jgi:hypothetical protein
MAAPIWLASAEGRLDDLLQFLNDTQNGPQEVDVKGGFLFDLLLVLSLIFSRLHLQMLLVLLHLQSL